MNANDDILYKTSLLLVQHFKQRLENKGVLGIHSRIFSIILHPEQSLTLIGRSRAVIDEEPIHPEHVVPCAVLIRESCRLIEAGVPDTTIAALLAKHWRIAHISKNEAARLDGKAGLNLKSEMPEGWCFETGDTLARLQKAEIALFPIS
ncbi:MAG: hypothetical protein K0Q68_307 [Moraxellaceae bacterium]|jgi:hypothetical protein|nr:hypothetical protein [Moraxellaceae bacterium]